MPISLVFVSKNKTLIKHSLRLLLLIVSGILVLAILVCFFYSKFYAADHKYFLKDFSDESFKVNNFKPLRVAHAGGALGELTYTNSLQALTENYSKGFRYFEIDFNLTSDEKLICLHDWGEKFTELWGVTLKNKVTFSEFESLTRNNNANVTACTLKSLADWMVDYPDAVIITDVKKDNINSLKIIKTYLPNSNDRVIPQIYQPENFFKVRLLGFENIIWTLYKFEGDVEDVYRWVEIFFGNYAVTMGRGMNFTPSLARNLAKKDIPTYVHTINSNSAMNRYKKFHGFSEIYTDYLAP
ncbi:hypothetical protein KO507_00850 [Gilvimarinus agarilyticus]|uniref:glycerophosphodiester phosphodiesterase family protein n=1 Tax=Gilvimarinus sp. 2_MG-2023 TaxID=3062666 RepID=UPI001C09CBAC|nr:glycerophosphodiester phosphodiesterase family protein [Gilvimarinus sp. 2_MG-2023]MBU2884305.1 hypothetical protein [Gilvimarinus agarilyticus]MDO6569444.1 glycerophosphodiester phosphodiesterase family protein [Gilvimarinus sp. 2_MG-2023]